MGLLRSEWMVHKNIRIPKDTAIDVMEELGKLDDCIQFEDLNLTDFEERKNFGSLISRCDTIEKKISAFEEITMWYGGTFTKYLSYDTFKIDWENAKETMDKRYGSTYFDLIENEVTEDERKINELIDSYKSITVALDSLIEKKSVFDKSSQLIAANLQIQNTTLQQNSSGLSNILSSALPLNLFGDHRQTAPLMEEIQSNNLNFIAGVIKAEDDMRMKRMIFRASRGRAIPTFFDLTIENKTLKTKVEKKIFTIFYQGGEENILMKKIFAICDLFGASRFTIPKREDIPAEINAWQHDIYDKKTFLKSAETSIKDFIRDKIGGDGVPAKYEMYRLFFWQEKMIFTNLNKCKLRGNFIDGQVWIPQAELMKVQTQILKITEKDPSKLTAVLTDFDEGTDHAQPPTYLKLNDFVFPFQKVVNEYGMPRYREINPGLFAIISFPFLFGIMFGDIGHGSLLTMWGGYLVWKYDDIIRDNPSMKKMLKARYIFLFMGLFAFYNGWMYDDFFSMPLGIFGSCYKEIKNEEGESKIHRKEGCVYPFGWDPKWYVAQNELAFINSLKMKISVIIGIIQMIFGICWKGMNAIYFNHPWDFVFEFIPQFVFMVLLFGYWIAMIYIKWMTDWTGITHKAPSLISQWLMLFLNLGSTGNDDNKLPLWKRDDYTVQENFQYYILMIGLLCVPLMLIPKPIIEYLKKEKHPQEEGKDHKEETLTDWYVFQIIETIEFVLGTVSHTASYLRLWALSLAHGQLSKVFFDMTLLGSIQSGSIVGMMAGFIFFAGITLAVLMGMDLMECFLHTLRLHWVEFQGKFYKADGYEFVPYSFKYINDDF